MKEIFNSHIDEKYYVVDHSSGLKIMVYPKSDYKTSYAIFGTKYGSIDNCFKTSDEDDFSTVPQGIAHFLEHKLFENEEIDAFTRYAETGASANAYTSFDRTCYLFSTGGDIKPSLEILLDFVTSPYFTKETVEKEQGIIGQEIRMYDDEPGWRVLFNLLGILYHNNPVKIDIAGTVESISKIDDKLLYKCYNTFYNLNNMVLCVAGNVNVDEIIQTVDKMIKPAQNVDIIRKFPDEPHDIVKSYTEQKLSVAVPVFAIGFKEDCVEEDKSISEKVQTRILLDIISSNTSKLYNELFESGLINTTFASEYFTGNGFASIIFEGQSKSPKEVYEKIKSFINDLKLTGIDKEDFERSKKKLYGKTIKSYNDVENIANELVEAYFSGYDIFDTIDAFEKTTYEDISECLKNKLDCQRSAISIVFPK